MPVNAVLPELTHTTRWLCLCLSVIPFLFSHLCLPKPSRFPCQICIRMFTKLLESFVQIKNLRWGSAVLYQHLSFIIEFEVSCLAWLPYTLKILFLFVSFLLRLTQIDSKARCLGFFFFFFSPERPDNLLSLAKLSKNADATVAIYRSSWIFSGPICREFVTPFSDCFLPPPLLFGFPFFFSHTERKQSKFSSLNSTFVLTKYSFLFTCHDYRFSLFSFSIRSPFSAVTWLPC